VRAARWIPAPKTVSCGLLAAAADCVFLPPQANASFYHPICRKMVTQDLRALGALGGARVISWGGLAAVSAAAYLAWAVMRVRANKCPIPFVH
jgi:hypothetical protein